MTSLWILDSLHDCLCQICDSNFEIFQPNQFAAPAAHIQAFVNGAISRRLPDHAQWVCALNTNEELLLVQQLVDNPSLIKNESLRIINHNFHLALRHSLIVVENNLLIYHGPIPSTGSYAQLIIFPKEFYNVLFAAFHTIPQGPSELIPHLPPFTPALLLAGYALLHQEDVLCMPRMSPC
jgi:hypothetical protein